MKLLILLPVLLIAAIAGFNLYEEITAAQPYYMIVALHSVVTLVCLGIGYLLVKSTFSVSYTEENEAVIA
ncbi:MAG: hypothetical protein ACLGH8_18640 [Bacteroidia bacterium]